MNKTKLVAAIGLLATVPLSYAVDDPTAPYKNAEPAAQTKAQANEVEYDDGSYWGFTPTATVTFASDYIWRGVSQTQNRPAIQGSFDISHESGFYIGAWGSNVEFQDGGPTSLELDAYAGFANEFTLGSGDNPFTIGYDIGYLHYDYPLDTGALNFNEVYFGLNLAPVDKLNFSTYWYQDIGVENKPGIGYLDMGADYTLPDWAWGITILGHGGRYFRNASQGGSYWDWKFGASRQIAGFNVELAYTDTDGAGADGLDGAHFVASISRTFGDPIRSDIMPDGFQASASAALTTDYIWRGVSQTSNGPAIQGSFDISHESGAYVGIWGSNVEFDLPTSDPNSKNSLELDIYAGFSRETDFGGFLPIGLTYDVGWLHYDYPGAREDFNFNEIYGGLAIAPVENLNTSIYWYQDIGVENKFAIGYLDMGAEYTLPAWAWNTILIGHGGRYFKKDSQGVSYWDWKFGIAKDLGPFNFEVAYTDTDGAGVRPDGGNLDGAKAVGTISATF